MEIADILDRLEIERLTPMQEAAIEAFHCKGDMVLLSPTGSGKTLAFLLPLVQALRPEVQGVQAVVLVPSRELAMQIDSVFKRLGNDLYVDVNTDLYTAILGGEQLVNTLDGQVKLKVKPGTQNGTKVRLKGKGFPVYKKEGEQGDLIVTYHVMLPTNLTEQQKDLFRKIQSMN